MVATLQPQHTHGMLRFFFGKFASICCIRHIKISHFLHFTLFLFKIGRYNPFLPYLPSIFFLKFYALFSFVRNITANNNATTKAYPAKMNQHVCQSPTV